MSRAERRALVEREAPALPVSRQCRLLSVSRASVYRRPATISEEDCTMMALIDRQYLTRPYYGSRRMAAWLATQGHVVNRKRAQRLMRLAGLVAIYQRPNTSKPAVAHKIYPYLLGGISIERVNQVWCADVTYIPMARGFLYLVVIMDWVSRAVLAWRLSNTLDASFCVEALEEAIARFGVPVIFNTDQGAQFTADAFTRVLRDGGVAISTIDDVKAQQLLLGFGEGTINHHSLAGTAQHTGALGGAQPRGRSNSLLCKEALVDLAQIEHQCRILLRRKGGDFFFDVIGQNHIEHGLPRSGGGTDSLRTVWRCRSRQYFRGYRVITRATKAGP